MTDKLIRGAGGGGEPTQVNNTYIVEATTVQSRDPVETEDSLASSQSINFVDLLCEGEIEGFPSAAGYTLGTDAYNQAALKDVYIDGTPINSPSADPNNIQAVDRNFTVQAFVPKLGTQAQAAINVAISNESTEGVGVIVKNGSNESFDYSSSTQYGSGGEEIFVATNVTNASQLLIQTTYGVVGSTTGSLLTKLQVFNASNIVVAETTSTSAATSLSLTLTGLSESDVFSIRVNFSSTGGASEDERYIVGNLVYSYANATESSQAVTRQITDSTIDAVRVTLTWPALQEFTEAGDVFGSAVNIGIYIQQNGGGYALALADAVVGKSSQQYQKDYLIDLQGKTFPVDILVQRETADGSNLIQNDFYWTSYTEIIFEKLRYPNSAVVAVQLKAEDFSNIPSRTYKIRGLKVQIPSNGTVDQTNGRITYSGVWDGTFGAAVWTSDPAWVLWDLLTSTRYGFGDHISASQLDKFAFFSASQYCSELVPDGFGGQEPRFSCNVLIQNQDQAYTLINELCSVMRVMPYWATGTLTIAQDKPVDSSYLFTLANVSPEGFAYSGSSLKTRHTVAVVSYFDMDTQDLGYEYVEDRDAIAKYGVVTTNIEAFACTSRGQANRLGEWLLYSEQYETEVVTFTTSVDAGVLVRPGAVIEISDPVKAGVRRGGRISAATTTTVTVDDTASTDLDSTNNPTLSVLLPDGTVESKAVTDITGAVITVGSAFSAAPNVNSVWILQNDTLLTSTWRVLTIEESDGINYKITALSYNSSKYDYIERDRPLQQRDISIFDSSPNPPSNLTAEETLFERNGRAASKIIVSWDAEKGVSKYRVSYRYENDNWTSADVEAPTYEIIDSIKGTYEIHVYSLNAVGVPSNTYAALSFQAFGKTAPPEDPTGINVIPNSLYTAIVSWNPAQALDVILGGKVIIRHSFEAAATWENSNDIDVVGGAETQVQVAALEGTYLIKFEDDTGNRSVNAASATVSLPTYLPRLLVQSYREDQETPPFSGNLTNMLYSEEYDGLIINTGTNIDSMATDGDFDALPSIDGVGGSLGSGEYEFGSTLDLGGVFDMDLRRYLVTRAFLPGDLWDDNTALIDTWTSIDGDLLDDVNAKLYVRATDDNPGSSPTWGSWVEFVNAIERGRAFQFKVIATSTNAAQNIIIDELGCELELDQRTEVPAATITSGAATKSVTFADPFYQAPSIGISAFNLATGDFFEVSSITRTGFQISFKNSGSTLVSRDFTYTAIGYGREIT